MKKYETVKVLICFLSLEDVITASAPGNFGDEENYDNDIFVTGEGK